MARRGKKRDYSLDDFDYVCRNCRAPGSCATATCPRARWKQVQKLEAQACGLVGCLSTVLWAALTGQDAQTVRQRAERKDYGPARQVDGGHWCIGWDGALTEEVKDE